MMYFWDELGQQWTALRARNTHCKWRETLPDSVRGDVESIINVKHCTPHRALWTFIHAVAHKRSRRGVFLIAMTLYDADEWRLQSHLLQSTTHFQRHFWGRQQGAASCDARNESHTSLDQSRQRMEDLFFLRFCQLITTNASCSVRVFSVLFWKTSRAVSDPDADRARVFWSATNKHRSHSEKVLHYACAT